MKIIKNIIVMFILVLVFSLSNIYAKELDLDTLGNTFKEQVKKINNIINSTNELIEIKQSNPEIANILNMSNYTIDVNNQKSAIYISNTKEVIMSIDVNFNNGYLEYTNDVEMISEVDEYVLELVKILFADQLLNTVFTLYDRPNAVFIGDTSILKDGFNQYGISLNISNMSYNDNGSTENVEILSKLKLSLNETTIKGLADNSNLMKYGNSGSNNSSGNSSVVPTKDDVPDDGSDNSYTGKEDDSITNPQTGIFTPISLISIIILGLLIILKRINKKSLFKQI